MLNKKILMLTIIFTCLLAVSAVSAAENATDDVVSIENNNQVMEQTVNEETISATDDGTFTALQNKIRNAKEGSTITLENDYVYDDGFDADGISFGSKELTINGNGHSIDGLSKSRIFYISSGYGENYDITLNNIVFKNGHAEEGGAIYARATAICGNPIIINDCKFVKNSANDGGAISLFQGKWLKLSGCVFEENTASDFGGAIATGIESLVSNNCNFIKNSAKKGGAIFLGSINDDADVTNCTFTGNAAGEDGGAINSERELKIDSCKFNSNTCNGKGGAIFSSELLYLENSQFDSNHATGGGAIRGYSADIINCIFKNNDADSGSIIYDIPLLFADKNHVYNIVDSSFDKGFTDWGSVVINGNQLKVTYDAFKMKSYYDYYISAKIGSYDLGIKNLEYDPYIDYSDIFFSIKNIPNGIYNCEITGYYVDKDIDENEYIVSGKLVVPLTITSRVNIASSDITKYYGDSKKLVVRLTQSGNPLSNVNVNVVINGESKTIKTDANGQATMAINKAPGTYSATITYADAQTTSKITVKKATPKLTAKAKTLKKSDKTKKYTVTLKTNTNKYMSGKTVKITVNKKTYTAKTNSKGVATFKLTKLTKKAKYTATVKFAGNKYYNSKTVKNVKITVK